MNINIRAFVSLPKMWPNVMFKNVLCLLLLFLRQFPSQYQRFLVFQYKHLHILSGWYHVQRTWSSRVSPLQRPLIYPTVNSFRHYLAMKNMLRFNYNHQCCRKNNIIEHGQCTSISVHRFFSHNVFLVQKKVLICTFSIFQYT